MSRSLTPSAIKGAGDRQANAGRPRHTNRQWETATRCGGPFCWWWGFCVRNKRQMILSARAVRSKREIHVSTSKSPHSCTPYRMYAPPPWSPFQASGHRPAHSPWHYDKPLESKINEEMSELVAALKTDSSYSQRTGWSASVLCCSGVQ